MRIVAFITGLLAAALAFGLPLLSGVHSGAGVGPIVASLLGMKSIAQYVLYVPMGIAALGALVVLLSPASGALLLLVSALVWFGYASLKPDFFTADLLAPSGVALLAAILAFVGGEIRQRRDRDRELAPRNGFAARRAYREPDFDGLDDEPPLDDEDELSPDDDDMRPEPAATAARLSSRRSQPQRAPAPSRNQRRARYEDEEPPRRRGIGLVLVLNALVILGIVGGVAWFVLSGNLSAPNVAATTKTEAAADAPASEPSKVTPAVAETTPAAAAAGTFEDAEAYCAAVTTIDRPDTRYVGPAFTAKMANRLKIPLTSSPDRVRWRCNKGEVLVCASYAGPVCDQTPSVAEMEDFCRLHPEVPTLFAPAGVWSCVGGAPKLPQDAKWPVDDRGFFPAAWRLLDRPAAPATTTEVSPAPAAVDAAPAAETPGQSVLANPAPAEVTPAIDPAPTGSTDPAPAGEGVIDPTKVAPVPATRPAAANQPLNLGG